MKLTSLPVAIDRLFAGSDSLTGHLHASTNSLVAHHLVDLSVSRCVGQLVELLSKQAGRVGKWILMLDNVKLALLEVWHDHFKEETPFEGAKNSTGLNISRFLELSFAGGKIQSQTQDSSSN